MRITAGSVQQPVSAQPRGCAVAAPREAPESGREDPGVLSLSPAARLLGSAQVAYRTGVTERQVRVEQLRAQIAVGTYTVDRRELCAALFEGLPLKGGE